MSGFVTLVIFCLDGFGWKRYLRGMQRSASVCLGLCLLRAEALKHLFSGAFGVARQCQRPSRKRTRRTRKATRSFNVPGIDIKLAPSCPGALSCQGPSHLLPVKLLLPLLLLLPRWLHLLFLLVLMLLLLHVPLAGLVFGQIWTQFCSTARSHRRKSSLLWMLLIAFRGNPN